MDVLSRLERAGCAVKTRNRRDWIRTGDFSFEPLAPAASVPQTKVESREEIGLTDRDITVLTKVARSNEPCSAESLAQELYSRVVVVQYHIDRLIEAGYITDRLRRGSPPTYVLTKEGRAYAVENELISDFGRFPHRDTN